MNLLPAWHRKNGWSFFSLVVSENKINIASQQHTLG